MFFKPVIFGGYVNGYSLARTFKETYGINSIICDHSINIAYFSKFTDYRLIHDPKNNEIQFIEDVRKIGLFVRESGEIPILLVTNDIWLIPLSKLRNDLEEIFMFTFSDCRTIDELANKNKLYALCDKIGVDYPKTFVYCNQNKNLDRLVPPIIIKPSNVPDFISFFPNIKPNGLFANIESAIDYLENLYSKGFNGRMIIQEYIPGGVENLYTCTSYSTKKGIVKGISIGCKLSQYPEEAGTITSGLIKYKSEVERITKKILEHKKFFGIANTEFKYDERDDSYKLIEVNARPGMWNYSSLLSGVNLIEKMVDDLIFDKNITSSKGEKQLIWTRVSNKEILKHVKSNENFKMVKSLIIKGEVYDPLSNPQENLRFKIRVRILNLKLYSLNHIISGLRTGFSIDKSY